MAALSPSGAPVSRDKLILLVGLITYGMGQSLLFVIFTPLARELGLTAWQLGLVIAASNVALTVSAPRWGRVSDRWGRKPVFLTGMAGYAIGYAALALGVQAGLAGWLAAAPLFALLIALRLCYGLVVGAINPAATAYIADTTDEQSRAKGMALLAMSGGLGTILGPAFGGALAFVSPVFPMYAAALLAVIAGAWALVALPEPPRQARAQATGRLGMFDGRVLPYLAGWVVVFGVFTGVQTITVYFIADRYGVTAVATAQRTMMFALLAMALCTLVVQAVVLQKWKATPGTLLRTGFGLMVCALLLLAFGPAAGFLYLSYAVFGLSFGFTAPGLNAAGSLSVRPDEQGAVAGLLSAAPTVGMIFGPILCSASYRLAPTLPVLGGAALTLLVLVWFLFVKVPDPRG
jgi:MFS family permease